MRTPKIERKIEYFPIVGCNIKATNDAQGITEGYLNYIGNIDFGDDRTMKGAFTKTLTDSYARKSQQGLDYLWPYLWNHDYSIIPPGGIFEASEDHKGLYIKTQYNLDMQMGRELYSSFKLGTMKKQSMGYRAINVDWVKDGGRSIRNLLEVAVMEGSAVVFPMNDLATVEVVKSQQSQNQRRNFYMPDRIPPTKAPALSSSSPSPSLATRKDFGDRYRAQVIDDWLCSDWYDLTTALRQSIQDIFAVGDQPLQDLENLVLGDGDNSQGFISALRAYVQEGIDIGYSNYLQEQADANSSSSSDLYWMSNNSAASVEEQKAGRALSAANHAILKKATDGIVGHVKDIKSVMTAAQQQGYPRTMGASADQTPHQKQEEDAEISTLLASINIKNAFRSK